MWGLRQVEFRVNGQRTDYSMKLGEGGEAFFIFETNQIVPPEMQTSPLVSPSASPRSMASAPEPSSLQEPDYLNIADTSGRKADSTGGVLPNPRRARSDFGKLGSSGEVFFFISLQLMDVCSGRKRDAAVFFSGQCSASERRLVWDYYQPRAVRFRGGSSYIGSAVYYVRAGRASSYSFAPPD